MTAEELERLERQAQRSCANVELVRGVRERLLEIEQNVADIAQTLLLIVEAEKLQNGANDEAQG